MKKLLFLAVVVILILSGLLVWQAKKSAPKEEAAAATAKADEPPSRVSHGANGETIIKLDASTRDLMGLVSAPLEEKKLTAEIKAVGRVMDPVILSSMVSDFLSARATAEVSRKESERLQILAKQNNASARTVEAAQGTLLRDAALAETAHARLAATLGNSLANETNLVDFVKMLASGQNALVLLDLPVEAALTNDPTSASLVAFADDAHPVSARFVGRPMGIDPQTQTRGLLFLADNSQSRLGVGAMVTGFIQSSGESASGFMVPSSAILYFNGATWIYVEEKTNEFERTEIKLGRPLDNGWFAPLEVKAGTRVVIVAAQQLLSEELKGQLSGD